MRIRNRNSRPHLKSANLQMSACVAEPIVPGTSFRATLSDCVQTQMGLWSPLRSILSLFRPSEVTRKGTSTTALARTWEWMHAKYTLSATKRLRVTDTVALGEKRFVAIVSIEGREFLIGGGTAGISLLAHLGSRSEHEDKRLPEFGVEGGTE
jgi:hypothetical protein